MGKTALKFSYDGEPAKRSDEYHVDPRRLTLITDPDHVLYQSRVHRPFTEEMVQEILEEGVKHPILVRKNGFDQNNEEIWEVIAGRRRVINALEALRRQIASGVKRKDLLLVPVKIEPVSDDRAENLMILENAHREEVTPTERADEVRRWLNRRGDTPANRKKLARLLKCAPSSIDNMIAVTAATPAVKEAVDKGELSLRAGAELAERVPRANQKAVLDKAREIVKPAQTEIHAAPGSAAPRITQADVREAAGVKTERIPMTTRHMEQWRDALAELPNCAQAKTVLDCVLGDAQPKDALAKYLPQGHIRRISKKTR